MSDLSFSQARGLYEQPFDLVVDRASAGRVLYTLDGSDPRTSGTRRELNLPAQIRIDPDDTTGRFIAPAVVLRAYCPEQGELPGMVATHTYLFINRVRDLSPDDQAPGEGWPSPNEPPLREEGFGWGDEPTLGQGGAAGLGEDQGGAPTAQGGALAVDAQRIDYGMDPDVTEDPAYTAELEPALRSLPSVSLVSDLENFFDEDTGILVNALERGEAWERPGSLELLLPDGGEGFQVNTGIRVRGGYSRVASNPKHAFRLLFREEYGAKHLDYALFGEEGVDRFDKLDLRTAQNYSWSYQGNMDGNTMNRDVFSRDLQRELGQPYTRSRYYHLYLNGVYWGLFQSQERSESHFGESYLGGDEDDYDTVKVARDTLESDPAIEATDGTLDAWNELYALSLAGFASDIDYYRIEGLDASGVRDPNLPVLVDIDNLIDYMLVTFYTANFDGPVSKFYENQMPNNFFALYNRANLDAGFVFFAHDNEHTLHAEEVWPTIGVEEDRVNIGETAVDERGRPSDRFRMDVASAEHFHPQWLHHRLTENPEYRTRFAARAHEVLEGDGPLTPERARALFDARAAEIELAIIAESARWGDAHATRRDEPRTKNDDWVPAIQAVQEDFFPVRTALTIEQLTQAGLY